MRSTFIHCIEYLCGDGFFKEKSYARTCNFCEKQFSYILTMLKNCFKNCEDIANRWSIAGPTLPLAPWWTSLCIYFLIWMHKSMKTHILSPPWFPNNYIYPDVSLKVIIKKSFWPVWESKVDSSFLGFKHSSNVTWKHES